MWYLTNYYSPELPMKIPILTTHSSPFQHYLNISYLGGFDILRNTYSRRNHLFFTWHFVCFCDLCKNEGNLLSGTYWQLYNVKTLWNYEIMNQLFCQKNTLFMILLQFRTILFPYKCKQRVQPSKSLSSNGFV